ncbi:MAG: hypothetical protein H7336_04155, partial [Bacteriovorax sp.]|nr:hypothetical protein [Bacteriovorax sp.]
MKNKNQSGFSIVMVLVSLSLVVGASYFVMGLNKNSKQQSARAKNTSFTELERRRISAVLADSATCGKSVAPINFFGLAAVRGVGSFSTLYTFTGDKLVDVGQTYFGGTLRLDSMETRVNPDNPFLGTSKNYELVLYYKDIAHTIAGKTYTNFIGKKQTIIRIPMYMNNSAAITECYAITENTDIDTVVNAACSPATSTSLKNSYINAASGTTIECQHNITFDPGPLSTDCPLSTAFAGFDQNTTNGQVSFLLTRCTGMSGGGAATTCTAGQFAYGVSASTIQCAVPVETTRDPTLCTSGYMLYHGVGNATSCVAANCTGSAYDFVQSISSSSTTCYTAPTSNCPVANTYAYQIDLVTGAATCKILPIISGSCAASWYGTSVTRATTTANGTLNCGAYNKAKICSPNNSVTFMTGM